MYTRIFPLLLLFVFFGLEVWGQTFKKVYPEFFGSDNNSLTILNDGYRFVRAGSGGVNDILFLDAGLTGESSTNLSIDVETPDFSSTISGYFGDVKSFGLTDGTFLHAYRYYSPLSYVIIKQYNQQGELLGDLDLDFESTGIAELPVFKQLENENLLLCTTFFSQELQSRAIAFYQYDFSVNAYIVQQEKEFEFEEYDNLLVKDIWLASDGGYFVHGIELYDKDILIRFDSTGQMLWYEEFPSISFSLLEIAPTSDGGAWVWHYSNLTSDVIKKIDADGVETAQMTTSFQGVGFSLRGIAPRSDNGVVFIGRRIGQQNILVSGSTDENGVTTSLHEYSFVPVARTEGQQTIDGYYLFFGQGANKTILIKTDANGIIDTPPPPPQGTDLHLTSTGDTESPNLWNTHSVTITLTNEGNEPATGITVAIPTPEGEVYVGGNEYEASQGTFDIYTTGEKTWNVGDLADGESAEITINYFRIADVPFVQYAQVSTQNEEDLDSTPGNGNGISESEDDETTFPSQEPFDPCDPDEEGPAFSFCPDDQLIETNETAVLVNWEEPEITDACGMVTIIFGPELNNTEFTQGTTEVLYQAVDEAGNESTCSFIITVQEIIDPCNPDVTSPALTCPAHINLSTLEPTGMVAEWTMPGTSDECSAVTLESTTNSGEVFPIGSTEVIYTATDAADNTSQCSFTVTVALTQAPGPCTDNFIADPGFEGGFDPFGWQNDFYVNGDQTTDAYNGNLAMIIEDENLPGRIFLGGMTATPGETYSLSAFAKISDLSETASIYIKFLSASYQPILIEPVEITTTDYNEFTVLAVAPPNAVHLEIGLEKFYGDYAVYADEFCLTTELVDPCDPDEDGPIITNCPNDLNLTSPDASGTIVTWDEPAISDVCGTPSVSATHNSGDLFPLGITTVTYSATDDSGNQSICSFTVTVEEGVDPCDPDLDSPIVTCPDDIGVTTYDASGAIVEWPEVQASDDCSVVALESNFESGALFSEGITIVTYTASDTYGNVATCSFEVAVTVLEEQDGSCVYNMFSDPGVESESYVTPWRNFNFPVKTTDSYTGNYGARTAVNPFVDRFFQEFHAVPNDSYTLSVYCKATGLDNPGYVYIRFLTNTFETIVFERVPINSLEYELYTLMVTAPNNAAYFEAGIEDTGSEQIVYGDDFCLTRAGLEQPVNGPDLTINYLNIAESVNVGWTIGHSAFIENIGDVTTGAALTTNLYLSDDNMLSEDDILLIEQPYFVVGVEQTFTNVSLGMFDVPIVPSGEYYFILKIDGNDEIAETNENNNVIFNPVQINGEYPDLPDLKISALDFPISVQENEIVPFSFRLQNFGLEDVTSPFSLKAYFPESSIIITSSTPSVDLADYIPNVLEAGYDSIISGTLQIPNTIENGQRYVSFRVDHENNIAEVSESNNYVNKLINISGNTDLLPDYTVSNLIPQSSTVTVGDNVPYSVFAENIGEGNSLNDLEIRVYISSDPVVGPGDNLADFYNPLGSFSLAPGQGETINSDFYVTIMPEGTYYLIAIIDPGNSIEETNEENNRIITSINVLNNTPDRPDISFSNLNVPSNIIIGEVFDYSFTASNTGEADLVSLGTIDVYISPSISPTGNDYVIEEGESTLNSLAIGESMDYSNIAIVNNLLPGDYFFLVIWDKSDAVDESNEANNTIVKFVTVSENNPPPPNINCPSTTTITSDFPWHEWISRVAVNGEAGNESGKSPYSDFRSNVPAVVLEQGQNIDVEVDVSYSYTTYDTHVGVFIDMDGDGDFSAEEGWSSSAAAIAPGANVVSPLTINVQVPADAALGLRQMRVIASREPIVDGCTDINFGEVEDYLVEIVPGGAIAPRLGQSGSQKAVRIFPNPVENELYLDIFSDLPAQTVQVVDAYGHVKWTSSVDQRQGGDAYRRIKINTANWINGVYFIQVLGPFKPRTERVMVQRTY